MYVIIPEYWGYETNSKWYMREANHTLRSRAFGLVTQLLKCRSLGEKRIMYRRYFSAYKRIAHSKNYPGLFDKEVQNYIWSFAYYCAHKLGYDLEELENDWFITIQLGKKITS